MRHYKPLYGNPATDRLYGVVRGDVALPNPADEAEVSEVTVSEAVLPEGVIEGELQDAWSAVQSAFQTRYGISLSTSAFEALDTAFQIGLLQSMVEQESQILSDDEIAQTFADMIAEEMGIEGAAGGVESLEDLENDERNFEVALNVFVDLFPNTQQAAGTHDIVAVVADALDAIESELDILIQPIEVRNAVAAFKNIGFPEYSAEELVEILAITAQGNDLLIELEKEEMLSDDTREDAICSDKANAIILAQFGEQAAASHKALCALSPAERMAKVAENGGSLAATLGIPASDWESFVLDSIDNIITPELLAQEGAALSLL